MKILRYYFRRFCMRVLGLCPRCWNHVYRTTKGTCVCPICPMRSSR